MLQRIRRVLLSEYGAAFCFSLCIIFALTYQEWLAFDVSKSVDPKAYWGLAHFDFDQSVVRKYRVIVPFIVRGLYELIAFITQRKGDMVMKACFYLVNMLCSATWCTLVYAYVRTMKCSKVAALIAVSMVATCFWTVYNTAAFMTDSFYCIFVALTFIAIEKRNSKLLFWSIIIGPFAKEAYLFLLPVIFFYSHVPKMKLISWFVLSGVLVFGFHYSLDYFAGPAYMPAPPATTYHVLGIPIRISESLQADLDHFTYIPNLIHRFEEPSYVNPIIALIGLWLFIPLGAMVVFKGYAKHLGQRLKGYMLLWFLLVFLQMIISGDFSRMLYLYMPIYGFMVGTAVDYWRSRQRTLAG